MKKLLILFYLFIVAIMFAQVDFELHTPSSITYNSFSPANFDPDHPDLQPILFSFTLAIDETIGLDYRLRCTLDSKYPEAVITMIPITIQTSIPITNRDIIIREGDMSGTFSVSGNFGDFIDAMEDDIMSSGRVPDGAYSFFIEALSEDETEVYDAVTITMTIESPITISLVTPGNPLSSTPASISTQYPEFIWFSNLGEYTLKLYELDTVMNSSEDIEQQYEPILEIPNISGTSFTYPPGAPAFNLGNVYAWQISAESITPSGTSLEKSIMYHFVYSQQGQTSFENQQIINFFNQLGNEQFEQIITLLESGYSFANLTWEGENKTLEQLSEIIRMILNGEIQLEEITVE